MFHTETEPRREDPRKALYKEIVRFAADTNFINTISGDMGVMPQPDSNIKTIIHGACVNYRHYADLVESLLNEPVAQVAGFSVEEYKKTITADGTIDDEVLAQVRDKKELVNAVGDLLWDEDAVIPCEDQESLEVFEQAVFTYVANKTHFTQLDRVLKDCSAQGKRMDERYFGHTAILWQYMSQLDAAIDYLQSEKGKARFKEGIRNELLEPLRSRHEKVKAVLPERYREGPRPLESLEDNTP